MEDLEAEDRDLTVGDEDGESFPDRKLVCREHAER